jgi:hypothetical protein
VVHALNSDNTEQSEGLLSPVYIEDPHLLLEYWATRIAEARATMARVLNSDNTEQNEGLLSPTYIKDSYLLLEYWAARTAEARARVEERLALARLNINMDIALKESNDMILRLEAALEFSPKAKEKLMNGEMF